MDIQLATTKYEAWMAQRLTPVPADLESKHRAMAQADTSFPFLRATFYRWAQVFPQVCADLATAPVVLAVGDLHVENFGTWRDAEGRLIWGVNDLDEAHAMPYPNDLVRLAVSAGLARQEGHLTLKLADACEAILTGYTECLKGGGKPFVLAEGNHWLRGIAQSDAQDPVTFWAKIAVLPHTPLETIPLSAREAMEHLFPDSDLPYHVVSRVAGLGSLGRQRFMALTAWRGGTIAREAKALLPSAWAWANHEEDPIEILYQALLSRAVRCPDPFVELRGQWITRRLAPDCFRIELTELPKDRDEDRLLYAMGWETGNMHLGSAAAIGQVRQDVGKRSAGWLRAAAAAMTKAVVNDWESWGESYKHAR